MGISLEVTPTEFAEYFLLQRLELIKRDVQERGDRRGMMLRGSEKGVHILGENMRRVFPQLKEDTSDNDWTILGIPVVVDDRVATDRLSLYVGEAMVAVLEPMTGEGPCFIGNSGVVLEQEQRLPH